MIIAGLQKTSLLDYPQKVSAIIFTQGCNFRCPFCYNPNLVTRIDKKDVLPQKQIFDFLTKRKRVLDAVVITGGEPTLHKDLLKLIEKIKKLDLLVKLDSNGTNPATFKELIDRSLIDYIAMDIKAPLRKYKKVANIKVDTASIKASIKLIMGAGLPYEFRSTILPAMHTSVDIEQMAKLIKGADKYYLQKFRPTGNLNDQDFNVHKSYTDKQMKELSKIAKKYVTKCGVR
jgi:pyruvate formate lyase activating enzyme